MSERADRKLSQNPSQGVLGFWSNSTRNDTTSILEEYTDLSCKKKGSKTAQKRVGIITIIEGIYKRIEIVSLFEVPTQDSS